jgi:hypothetical protein
VIESEPQEWPGTSVLDGREAKDDPSLYIPRALNFSAIEDILLDPESIQLDKIAHTVPISGCRLGNGTYIINIQSLRELDRLYLHMNCDSDFILDSDF